MSLNKNMEKYLTANISTNIHKIIYRAFSKANRLLTRKNRAEEVDPCKEGG